MPFVTSGFALNPPVVDAVKKQGHVVAPCDREPELAPMTMAFTLKDKRLFNKLVVGKTVNVELMNEGSGFVVTAVK